MSTFKDIADIEEKPVDKPVHLKEWTSLDQMTHDFTDSEYFREYCLEKYGQYMGIDCMRVTK
jgi:hypothetical protein